MYLHRKSLKFIFFLLIFGSLPNVIYLKCNLKDVLEVVAILSGDAANKLLKIVIIVSSHSQYMYYFILVIINFLIRSTLLHRLTLSLPAATFLFC